MKTKQLLFMLTSGFLAACTPNNVEQQVDKLYAQMTPQERIAQLHGMYLSDLFDSQGRLDTVKCRELIGHGIGHFSQYASQESTTPEAIRDKVVAVQQWLTTHTPSAIPALFHEEALTGVNTRGATVYPQQIGLACSFNPQLAEQKTRQTAATMRKIGGMLALSPMVDVVRNPSFNRLEESYGEDAYLSAVMGTAFVEGLQQGDLRKGVGACSKHFLGYGGGGDADERERMEEILFPHESIIRKAKSKVVMTGYHAVNGTNCVANRELQEGILRNYLHFDGMLVSDYGAIDQIPNTADDVHRAAAAINAGNDVDFPKGTAYRHLQAAVDRGLVSAETIEKAVKRVLTYKMEVGLFDKDRSFAAEGPIAFDTPEERKTAYELATQSVVLLKNNGVLPLQKPCRIALTGPNANTMWAMVGDYSFQSMRFFWQQKIEDAEHPRIVGLREGMERHLPTGMSMAYSRGCDWTDTVETIIEETGDERAAYMRSIQNRKIESGEEANTEEALKIAAQSDVIIAAMGENAILCGENRTRTSLRLPGRQEAFVEQLIATGKPVVLVIFGGRAQVVSGLAERCAAVIQAWYPGEEGGNAVADILYGHVSPSGKLSVSYPKEEVHEPLCYNKTVETDKRVAWPFGFGLSYTTFAYSNLRVAQQAKTTDKEIIVNFDVENTGHRTADEVVQLYLSPTDSRQQLRPLQLQGFARVSLKPGERRTVSLLLQPQQFGFYDMEHRADNGFGQWTVAPGKYEIKVGASSADIKLRSFITLTGKTHTQPLRDTIPATRLKISTGAL